MGYNGLKIEGTRRKISAFFISFLLFTCLLFPGGALAQVTINSGWGTAIIDGDADDTEWTGAPSHYFVVTDWQGKKWHVFIKVMNDDDNLYVTAHAIPGAIVDVVFYFDNDNDGGVPDEGDDILADGKTGGLGFTGLQDMVWAPGIDPGLGQWWDTTFPGGINDGELNYSTVVTDGWEFEFSKPLSGDSYDFNLDPGDTVGMNIVFSRGAFLGFPYWSFSYPALSPQNQSAYMKIVLAAGSAGEEQLVAYYPFEDNPSDGYVDDASGQGNKGSVVEAPSWTNNVCGDSGSALAFDGVDDGITVPTSTSLDKSNFQNGYTISSWVKPGKTMSGYRTILSKQFAPAINEYGSAFTLRLNDTQVEACHRYADSITGCLASGVSLAPGEWRHLAVAWDGPESGYQTIRIYVDGELVASDSAPDLDVPGTDGVLSIGFDAHPTFPRWYFDGVIDEVRLYNYALSESDIKGLMDSDCDGVPNYLDTCPSLYNPGDLDSDSDGFGNACDLCPEIDNPDSDGDGFADVCAASQTNPPGWGTIVGTSGTTVTVTFTYKGDDAYWIPPDCYNTVFISDPPIPQNCRRRAPYVLAVEEELDEDGTPIRPGYGIPSGDWFPVKDGDSWTITCDLSEIFDQNAIPSTPVVIIPTYTSFSTDRDYDPVNNACSGICVDTNQYHLFEGTIVADSGAIELSQGGVSAQIQVPIDIKPGAFPNTINLGSNGNVPVAIFSTHYFDATQVDPELVYLAGAGVRLVGKKGKLQASDVDINGDGFLDKLVHIDTTQLSLETGAVTAELTGWTYDGKVSISGTDSVSIVP